MLGRLSAGNAIRMVQLKPLPGARSLQKLLVSRKDPLGGDEMLVIAALATQGRREAALNKIK